MAQEIINTFDKGLHQDSAFILQPDGTYRNMKNGMLISFDGNHYTVEMTKGNRVLLTLTPRYVAVKTVLDIIPMPIGFASFIDKLVVFNTNSETTTGYGEIGVITFVRTGLDFTGTYVPYYHHASLNFTKLHKIEAWTFRENDNISRVYWTDNFNEPRVFDIADPMFTTYFTGTADLIVGDTYMVNVGAVTHNAINYGPGLTAGNIFTAVGTSYTVYDGTPLVIEYFPISLLDWTPTRLLGNITFQEYGTGNKNCGDSIYFYRLSNSASGFTTSWSYASNPMQIGMDNISTYLTGTPYRDFVGNGSNTILANSGKSVIVKVSDIDTNFDTIELCCAEFNQINDIPYRIIIVVKTAITASEMPLTDNGNTNLGTVTISDLTLFPASILKCKTGTTNKNYSIIANITEREEFELDLSGCTLTQFQYPLLSHGDLGVCTNGNVPDDKSPPLAANPTMVQTLPYTRWLVTFGNLTTDTVIYEGNNYVTGDVITGGTIYGAIVFTGTATVRPCTTKNRYTKISDGSRTENAIQLKTAFWDYKDPAVASHNKGYWSTEKYRFAFLAFDTKGNPFYCKYINDFSFSTIPAKGGLMKGSTSLWGEDSYALNPSAVKLSGLDLPESVMNQIKGFSIVRAERDPIVITQGLLMQNIVDAGAGNRVMPLGLNHTALSFFPTYAVGDGYYINSVICPDSLVGYAFNNPIGAVGSKMKEACWLDGSLWKGDGPSAGAGDAYASYSKMFADAGTDSDSPRTLILQNMNGTGMYSFDEGVGTPNFDGTGKDYYNQGCDIQAGAVGTVDLTCSTWTSTGFDFKVWGCKKLVIKTQFNHLGPLSDYNDSTNPACALNYNKMMANFITNTDASSQYGGVSPAALANTLYMSCGHFQPINAQVKADTLNGTFATGQYAGENKYTFNNIEIFGGDCFTNLVDIGYSLWGNNFFSSDDTLSFAQFFPCEGNVNYGLRRGRKVSNSNMFPMGGAEEISYDPTNKLEDYSYNKGYSTDGNFIKYPALPLFYKFTGKFEYRTRWAGPKYPGELQNSFRNFRIPDYRDLDGQRGQINNLKARDSKLFYWQDHGVGYTPILERQLVGGSALGDATALGVTGVIDRYDDIDTFFGNQHQHGLTETEYGFAWFDMRRRAFMVMGIGTKPEEMSMVKGLQVFFNGEFNEGNIPSANKIYNTNDLNVAEKPLMGYGIVGCYDPTFKMTYLTFKYEAYDTAADVNATLINRDFTLGYNHLLNAFVSFTDNCPAIWHNHNDLVLTANNPKSTKTYISTMLPNTSFVIGDTVKVVNTEYICIKNVVIASWPGTLTAVTGTSPLAPSSNSWVAINKTNEIYLHNFGAELCKFYGKTWSHDLEVIVNFKSDEAITPEFIKFKALGANWTSLTATTTDQTASDLNIPTTSRNYRYIDKAWFSSLPLPTNGRLTDYYVKLSFTFKNYVTDPRTAKNVQRVLQWLQTMFIKKK